MHNTVFIKNPLIIYGNSDDLDCILTQNAIYALNVEV